ncbi:MAG: lipopolysaccharide biosynthesis protein [Proteobacteria bacterium]|nr:lipopolysaccharide biosynthesis protein [Pseudomonadota bacterium]
MSTEKRALGWSFILNWAQQGFTALLTFILAAILGPESFGLLAIATVFTFFIQIIAGQPFIAVIIQRKELTEAHQHAAFWGVGLWSIFMALIAASLSQVWANLNDTPIIAEIILALCPLIVFSGFCIVPRGMLLRNLDFRKVTIITVLTAPVSGGVGIYLALNGYGVWALVTQQWVGGVLGAIILWTVASYKPRLTFDFKSFTSMLPFARGAFMNEMGGFVQLRADAALIGLLFGPVATGLYHISNRIIQIVVTLLTRSVTSFVLPYASRQQGDSEKLRAVIHNSLTVSTALTIPVVGSIAGIAPVILLVIGDQWHPAWTCLMLLAVVGAIQSISLLTPHLLQAVGSPMVGAAITWGNAVLGAIALIGAALFVEGQPLTIQLAIIAGSRASVFLIFSLPVSIILMRKVSGITFFEIGKIVMGPLIAGAVGGGVGQLLISANYLSELDIFLKFLIYGGLSGSSAVIILLLINSEVRTFVVDHSRMALNRLS